MSALRCIFCAFLFLCSICHMQGRHMHNRSPVIVQTAHMVPANNTAKVQQQPIDHAEPLRSVAYPSPADSGLQSRTLKAATQAEKLYSPHKPLWPVSARDMALFVLCFIIIALAAGAGVGGGVLLVSMLSMVGGFYHFLEVVALANVTILTGSIANLLCNIARRSPVKPGPIIDYDLLLLFGAPIIIGSIAGSKLNYFVPTYISKALVVMIVLPLAWRMMHKSKLLWDAETSKKRHDATTAAAAADASGKADPTAEQVHTTHHPTKDQPHDTPAVAARHQGPIHKPSAAQEARRVLLIVNPAEGRAAVGGRSHSCNTPHRHTACSPSMPGRHDRSDQQPQVGNPANYTRDGAPSSSHRSLPHLAGSLTASVWRRVSHTASRASSRAASNVSLADVLGPELMLLTGPTAAAAATVQLQQPTSTGNSWELPRTGTFNSNAVIITAGSGLLLTNSLASSRSSSTRQLSQQHHNATTQMSGTATPTVKDDDMLTDIDSECSVNLGDDAAQLGIKDADGAGKELLPSPYSLHHATLLAKLGSLQRQQRLKHQQEQQQQQPVAAAVAGLSCRRLVHDDCLHTTDLDGHMAARLERHATSQYPKAQITCLVATLLVVVLTNTVAHFFVACGTWQYWLLLLSPLPLMCLVWAVMRWHVLWRVGWQVHLDLMHPTDIRWTPRTSLLHPAICITVGMVAGLLGLGGCVIMAPLLLELGVHPAASAASSQAALLLSTSASSIVYLVNGDVPPDYGLVMGVLGFVGTLFGQVVINYIVRRTGRCSLLVFVLTLLFVLALGACVAMLGIAVAEVVRVPSRLTATRQEALCVGGYNNNQ